MLLRLLWDPMITIMLKSQLYTVIGLSTAALVANGKIGFLSAFLSGLAILIPNCLIAINLLSFKKNSGFLIICLFLRPVITLLLLIFVIKYLIDISWIWFYISVITTLIVIKIPFIVRILRPTNTNERLIELWQHKK